MAEVDGELAETLGRVVRGITYRESIDKEDKVLDYEEKNWHDIFTMDCC